MRWKRGQVSSDIEDRRGMTPRRKAAIGGGAGAIVAIVLTLVFGKDIGSLFDGAQQAPTQSASAERSHTTGGSDDPQGEMVQFISFVLDDIQKTWRGIFPSLGQTYKKAKLVLFEGQVDSACGSASAAVGPFYCPGDHKAYIDLTFYNELDRRFGAPGDFAQAYVLAHEIGHHVQNLLGTNEMMHRMAQREPRRKNELSVRLELQADCYAGVWAHETGQRGILEAGDVEEGLKAAAAIGDDTLQKRSGGQVQPESWTHGSSDQRVKWFRRGFKTGDVNQCDTFATNSL